MDHKNTSFFKQLILVAIYKRSQINLYYDVNV